MDGEGDFVIAWKRGGAGYDEADAVFARRYDAAGEPRGGEFRVNTSSEFFGGSLSAAMDASGDFVFAWSGGYGNVFARRYDSSGVPQGSQFRVNTNTSRGHWSPSVAMDADGDFTIAWTSSSNGYYYIDPEVFARRYTAAGVPQGEEFRVNTYTTGEQFAASVSASPQGDFIVAWSGEGTGDAVGVFAQRYAIVPEVMSSAFLFESAPHRMRFRFNHDVHDSLGADDLVVRNLTTGQTIPSNQHTLLYDDDSDVVTFIYLGSGSDLIGGVLPDGRYRATLLASGIVTPQGASPAQNHAFDFFFLNGDANRDGKVNLADFNILASNFGRDNTDFRRGDFTYDGTTDIEDFNILAGRFGQLLPPLAASPTTGFRGEPLAHARSEERDGLVELLR
jgi:hypothetical protein